MYDAIQALSMIAWVIFYIFYGKHFGFGKLKSFLISMVTLILFYVGIIAITWVESGFKNFGAQNAVRIFAFAPILFLIESLIFKVDFRKFCDFMSIWPMLWYGLGHLACISAGCCHGFQYVEGSAAYKVAHLLTGTNMLPNQLFESLSALLIFVILLLVMKKHNYNTGGRLFYVMLIVYGTQRIFWEFLRDNDKIVVFGPMKDTIGGRFGLSNLSFYAIAMVVVGIAFLIAFHIIDKKKAAKAIASDSTEATEVTA